MVGKSGPKKKVWILFPGLQKSLGTLKGPGNQVFPFSITVCILSRYVATLHFLCVSHRPKPLLTIIPEFWKAIDKPSMSMVNMWRRKNIEWWWFSGSETIEKPWIAMVPLKKSSPSQLPSLKYTCDFWGCCSQFLEMSLVFTRGQNSQGSQPRIENIAVIGFTESSISFGSMGEPSIPCVLPLAAVELDGNQHGVSIWKSTGL